MKPTFAMILIVLVVVSPVTAGLHISPSDGIMATGADGIVMAGGEGIVATGADGFLTFSSNGISAPGVDGIMATGADNLTYSGANGIMATGADSLTVATADGIMATGADGIMATGADGTSYQVNSISIVLPTGIVATEADGIMATGADGIMATGADGIMATGADGIMATGADGIMATGADGIMATGADGVTISSNNGIMATGADGKPISIPPGPLTLIGADLVVIANSREIAVRGAGTLIETGAGPLASLLSPVVGVTGLQSVDPELAIKLNQILDQTTDDRNVNAIIVYHHLPTDSDLSELRNIGIVGGTRFRVLPAVTVTGTADQILAISRLPAVRSIYGNRTLNLNSEPEVRAVTGVNRAWKDTEVTSNNGGLPVSGRNVTVALIDTGIDSTHGDLSGRVTKNIELASTQSASLGFSYPINSESLPNTDQAYGHGTFVAGVISGNGSLSGGKFSGVAPNARLVGLSAGDLALINVLEGFDYLLANGSSLGVRVVNCSFSTNALFDVNDPVNVATKMLTDAGVNVVFSAGNNGPGQNTLNPYAVAPWVVSVGATDSQGRLASFSSRGGFADPLFHPTLVAPGVDVVSLRGSGIANVTGAAGLAGSDSKRLSSSELLHYTTANGTSFSAPQIAGAIALMLEANPSLTPAEVKDILQRSATPLPPYYMYEAGTGMLNVHAAVLEAAIPTRRIGTWRGTLDRDQVEFASDAPTNFSGIVQSGQTSELTVNIPEGALSASINISWGPFWSTNDLGLAVYDSMGVLRGQANTLNLSGLTGKREGVTLLAPGAGTWKIKVSNTFGGFSTPQQFYGALQINRARYARMNDVDALSPTLRDEVYQVIRSFTMWPIGAKFRVDNPVTRLDLAAAMVLGARVPQYLPAKSSYKDVADATTMLFVESAQTSPTGALFTDVSNGGQFRPNENVTRLVAAVALVRAAGLRADAESYAGPLPFLDAASIPSSLGGYVSVAVSKGLIETGSSFRPNDVFTRGDLARAVATIQRRAAE
jgi:serine protease AprX